MVDTVRVYVNGVQVEVPRNAFVIDAVEKAGFRVPVLCYLEGLFEEATCRICVVLVNGRVVPSCRFPVSEEAKIVTEGDELTRYRRTNLELLLSTHRVKCWSCIRKSNCSLLEVSKQLGIEGLPVCSECPLIGDECLITKGEPCLGPLTVAGCSAECPRYGAPCVGCRGYLSDPRIWEDATVELYRKYRVDVKEIEATMKFFWSNLPERLREVVTKGGKP
ncbi:MAG: 2Fe-2S iron-sulfur cluster-binding protein [Sulfolobales archaeon]